MAWEAGFDPLFIHPSPSPPLNITGKYYQLFEERVVRNAKVSHGIKFIDPKISAN